MTVLIQISIPKRAETCIIGDFATLQCSADLWMRSGIDAHDLLRAEFACTYGFVMSVQFGENTALRVFNPARPQRERFSAIDTYRPDPAWRLPAVFEPAVDETIRVTSIDGTQHEEAIAGRLRFALRGVPHELTATRSAGALHVVFGDGTNGVETYRFRFLTIDEPAADGTTVVDFTRAYLPPCAFSDQFVCPRPHEGNRFAVSIRAGERAVVLGR